MADSADDPCDDLTKNGNLSEWTQTKNESSSKPLKTNETKMRSNRN